MRQLQARHILLFRLLRDHCRFLTRGQIQRILTLAPRSTNKQLDWLMSEGYVQRRHIADTFQHFQRPVYYLGRLGWQMVGKAADEYGPYRRKIERRSERQLDHTLSIYDVLLKFLLEGDVKRIVPSEDRLWLEALDFGNIPDAWIQFGGGEAFIEVDRGTERPVVLKKKFTTYTDFKESGRYDMLFPGCSFKVLVLTRTEERIESLERFAGSDDIWFCTIDEFLREKLDHQHWFALHGFHDLPIVPKEEV